MNKAQVTGLRGQTRLWSSTIVDTQFFTDAIDSKVTIYNPHLIVGYYHLWGMPLFMNLDFDVNNPLVDWQSINVQTESLPFDSENYANTYAYRNFASQNQEVNGVNQDVPPSSPVTLSKYNYQLSELIFYWYKTINEGISQGRSGTQTPNNPFLKTTTYPDNIGNHNATQINNNFASFSAFNWIDMLDESYCDIAKYFVRNNATPFGGVQRVLNSVVFNDWVLNMSCAGFLIQILYMDRGKGFEFNRQVIP
jgi:hypothetical protein